MAKSGLTFRQIAKLLGISDRTLTQWKHDWKEDRLDPRPRGRPARRDDPQARNEMIDYLNQMGPTTGVPTLQARFPDLARREVEDLKRRYRKAHARKKRRQSHVFEWTQPGSVWAIDFSHAPMPIDGLYPHFLAVRDLASGYQLLWLPTFDETAQTAIGALGSLFARYGPPLVLKSDNGSHFIADQAKRFLETKNVHQLLSPVRTPQYNGSLEAANGWMKIRTFEQAIRNGRDDYWKSSDAEAARMQANHVVRPGGPNDPTHEDLWQRRRPITLEQRELFAKSVRKYKQRTMTEQGYEASADADRTGKQPRATDLTVRRPQGGSNPAARGSKGLLGKAEQVLIERISVRRALGFLQVRRRRFPLPLIDQFPANIS